jgi:hypothetical protein
LVTPKNIYKKKEQQNKGLQILDWSKRLLLVSSEGGGAG